MARHTTRTIAAVLAIGALIATGCGGVDSPIGEQVGAENGVLIPQQPMGPDRDVGVSDTEVRVAIVYEDTAHDRGQPERAFGAAIDFANKQGGADGREIVPVFFAVDPTDETAAAAVCEQVAEAEVFAVIGELGRGESECHSVTNETVVINLFDLTDAELQAAQAPLLSLRVGVVRFGLASVQALDAAGELDGHRIAIHTDSWAEDDIELFVTRLESKGAQVVARTEQVANPRNRRVARAEMDQHAVAWMANGADTVLGLEDHSAYIVDAIKRNGLPMRAVISQTNTVLLDQLGADPAVTPTISLQTVLLRDMYWNQRYGVLECIQRYQKQTGDPVNVDAAASESDNLDIVVRGCGAIELFDEIVESTGGVLTNHTFTAAIEGIGELTLTGMEAASVGVDKRHVQDSSQVITDFDSAERVWISRESASG